jgi:hypothetical protein
VACLRLQKADGQVHQEVRTVATMAADLLVNQRHKLLESVNSELATVATDIMETSHRAMLLALLEGRTDPAVLAEILSHVDNLDEAIACISAEIIRQTATFASWLDLIGSNGMDPPLSSVALMSQNGCDIVGNHSPRGGRSHGTADTRSRH